MPMASKVSKVGAVDSRLLATAANLASLVHYQTDSVVSRTMVESQDGTLTLFAFDAGQGLSEHAAPFEAVVYIVEGEAEVMIADKRLVLSKGDITIIPANIPHAVKALQRFKMLLTMIKS